MVSDVRKSNRLNGYYFSIAKPVTRDGRGRVLRSIVKAEKLLIRARRARRLRCLARC
ncbi:MAG: hypothetical protein ACLTMP_03480 [Eggerthella lenta]